MEAQITNSNRSGLAENIYNSRLQKFLGKFSCKEVSNSFCCFSLRSSIIAIALLNVFTTFFNLFNLVPVLQFIFIHGSVSYYSEYFKIICFLTFLFLQFMNILVASLSINAVLSKDLKAAYMSYTFSVVQSVPTFIIIIEMIVYGVVLNRHSFSLGLNIYSCALIFLYIVNFVNIWTFFSLARHLSNGDKTIIDGNVTNDENNYQKNLSGEFNDNVVTGFVVGHIALQETQNQYNLNCRNSINDNSNASVHQDSFLNQNTCRNKQEHIIVANNYL